MQFHLVPAPADGPQSARFDESLVAMAASHGPVASLWEAGQGLVVPRTYQRYERFKKVCEAFAKKSWPVTVRLSGGGIVPQGPGIINLSLAYAVQGLPLDHSNAAYERICCIIQSALKKLGIDTQPQAVQGSFCDGRYNLAWGKADAAKKVVGTAQLWRRVQSGSINAETTNELQQSEPPAMPQTPAPSSAPTAQIVLVHALILAAINVDAVTGCINRFEHALDSGKRYDPERVASLSKCQNTPFAYSDSDFIHALKIALTADLTRLR